MKILIPELNWKEGIKELEKQGFEVDYDETLWKYREKLLQIIQNYDAVIVRNQTNVDKELLNAGSGLKVVGRLGVGLDNIDLKAAHEQNIKIVYARNANATSVAEYVMAAILHASRSLHFADMDIKTGNWSRKKFIGNELFNKTMGLIGMGEIAHRVAKRAKAFGMRVVGYDPFVSAHDHIASETGVEVKESLLDLLAHADFISLHVPLTATTKNMISYPELKAMKSTAYIINTSRGGILHEEDLSVALINNVIAGAYLDVLEVEPIESSNKLLTCNNVTITPHIAGLTNESQVRTSLLASREVGKILKGEFSLCTV